MLPPSVQTLGDRYFLEERIAAGGMGEVWRARDRLLGRVVAVKLLRPEYADNFEFRERLRWEGRHAAVLSHPGIAQVYDYDDGSSDGVPYLVMEYLSGRSLSEILLAEGTLPPRTVLGLVARTAESLACAHAAGVVHRDVKPANLLVDGDNVKVTDFGISRAVGAAPLTGSGMVMGTPLYMSPEQVCGSPASPLSDLYALGVIAWECLAGRVPFEGNGLAVAVAHRDQPLPPLPATVPEPVRELIAALTDKDPAARPAGGSAVAAWAWRLHDDPQVAEVPAGPAVAAVPIIEIAPVAPAGHDRALRRRVLQCSAALVIAALCVWAGWAARHPLGEAVAPAKVRTTRAGVTIDPMAYYGLPTDAAVAKLRALGLNPVVHAVSAPGRPTGTVVGITPSGDVAQGTTITLFSATATPAGSRPSATPHSTAPPSATRPVPAGSQRANAPGSANPSPTSAPPSPTPPDSVPPPPTSGGDGPAGSGNNPGKGHGHGGG